MAFLAARLFAFALVALCCADAVAAGEAGVRVLIVYHSQTGHTARMAGAVAEGAQSVPDTSVVTRRPAEVTPEELLGADAVIASRLSIADGRYTGDIDFYAYAENKAVAIEELADRRGYDLARSYAYSDSITDVHMLEAVGHPSAVNPDKELRRVAKERGWPVLVFSRPVALGSRMRLPDRTSTLAALAAGTAVVVGGAIYLGARRRLDRLGVG